jgi:hypothetical protein
MQETERVIDGFVKYLGIRKRLGGYGIEKLIQLRELQNIHGAFLQDLLDQRDWGYVAGVDPDIAFCCLEDCECSFRAVLWRQEQGLREVKRRKPVEQT